MFSSKDKSDDRIQRILTSPVASPAAFAEYASAGRWKRYRHLQLLNEFLLRFAFGYIRRGAISMPPQHGKSEEISHYYPPWHIGMFPEDRIGLAGYEASFARSWGRKARDEMEAHGEKLWGLTVRRDSKAADAWNLVGHRGGMITAGVKGGWSGKAVDRLLIDDPIKDAKEAQSKKVKDGIWDWYLSTARSRLSKGGGILIVATRWAKDDLIGRVLNESGKGQDQWEVLNLPAIAEEDEKIGLTWTRKKGEPLCEELHPLKELVETKASIRSYWWGALYQGRPSKKGGKFFKRGWFRIVAEEDMPTSFSRMVRYWDKAATEADEDGGSEDPDWTVGILMGMTEEVDDNTGRIRRRYYVLDEVRIQESPRGVRSVMRQTAMIDGPEVEIRVEEEGGSSGKDVGEELFELFDGYAYQPDKVRVKKSIRADAFAAAAENERVYVKKAKWNGEFFQELEEFPGAGAHDDRVDAASGAFRTLSAGTADITII